MAPNLTPIKIAKIGRNVSCPCGSGKKDKYCCALTGGGRLTETLDQTWSRALRRESWAGRRGKL